LRFAAADYIRLYFFYYSISASAGVGFGTGFATTSLFIYYGKGIIFGFA
jgi:hypothetical protein